VKPQHDWERNDDKVWYKRCRKCGVLTGTPPPFRAFAYTFDGKDYHFGIPECVEPAGPKAA
jgi:hypothetical protein